MSYSRSRHASRFGVWTLVAVVGFVAYESSSAFAGVPNAYQIDYQTGFDDGYQVGYDEGFLLGLDRGEIEGTADGHQVGFDDGWDHAYQPAYDTGYGVSHPIGRMDGYQAEFEESVAEGFQWAQAIQNILVSPNNQVDPIVVGFNPTYPKWATPLIDRWGDPNNWGKSSNVTITSIAFIDTSQVNWAAHYYEEGYDEGKPVGDQAGYDEAYPLAYQQAYADSFELGSREGELQGLTDGSDDGYEAGWLIGSDHAKDDGFTAGADFFAAGGTLTEFDPTLYYEAYSSEIAASVAIIPHYTSGQDLYTETRVQTPEPASWALVFCGIGMLLSQRSR